MSENIKRMLAERDAAQKATAPTTAHIDTEFLFEQESTKRLFHFLDEGWAGTGWRPSALLTIGYSALATLPDKDGIHFRPAEERSNKSTVFWQAALGEARRRYRDGFFADPFTANPRRRPA